MSKKIKGLIAITAVLSMSSAKIMAAENNHNCVCDSVEMLAYSAIKGGGGMHLAWRCNSSPDWKPIGNGYSFVNSDFGPWGSHKTMFSPMLQQNADGSWTATWIADADGCVLATVQSPDLKYWGPQSYTIFTGDRPGSQQYSVEGKAVAGNIVRVPKSLISDMTAYTKMRHEKGALYGEQMKDDATRFAGLSPLTYTVKAEPKKAKKISDKLIGIFFEDINYAADGGLYAELIQNRDFEYNPGDRGGDKNWNPLTAWMVGENAKGFEIKTENPIHPNNPHYISITPTAPGFELYNEGFDGIAVKAGEKYDFSFFARSESETVTVSLINPKTNATLALTNITVNNKDWKKYDAVLTPDNTASANLRITINGQKPIDIDMVSLFPQNTFKGRKNGLRADLAQTLANMKPQFVRFPGGCVAHGDGVDNIYDWKGSIGPLEARKPLRNLWGYHQTRGLGYHEYFQFCEDIGAEPLPVLAAGVPCQNSGTKAHHSHDALTTRGQQCGIPMEEMDSYVQDVLDLIEYANGDVSTEWGAKRAEAGHPEPFNLKYIGIGNEDMITEVFVPRFTMIYEAVRKAHPEIEVVGTVGPFYEGTDYVEGWKLADELEIPLVDEHYYVAPGWMIYNQDYYDNYKRNATKVYLGEYAAHVPGRASNIETALAEALYLTSVERNGDVVEMTSYAPLFSKDGHTQWRPDLIYFDNTNVRPSVDYYVQALYGQNAATSYIPANVSLNSDNEKAKVRVGSSIVRDEATGDVIIKLANLLPVSVKADIDLNGLKVKKSSEATLSVITGDPEDTDVIPAVSDFQLKSTKKLDYEMPAYSFSVIRIPGK